MADDPVAAHAWESDPQYQWALEQQRANALPRTDFYDPPQPLDPAPPGSLIRQESTAGYHVLGAPLPATRVLYHSRTSRGRDVAASGVVLVPSGTPPEGGWPVVADAHGTSGMSRGSAPSLMRDLYHGDQMAAFLEHGFAVVAPDYAGLGTGGEHEFLNKTAAANDVLAAVPSARQAVPGLSENWVVWGHSQGGGAALALAERQHENPAPGYLGAVVTSPAADLAASVHHLAGQSGLGGFLALIAAGAKAGEPDLRPDRLLTPAALDRLDVARTEGLGVVMAVYADLSGADLVQPGYLSDPVFAAYLQANSTGSLPVGGPVLLLQGEADPAIPTAITDSVAGSLRRAGAEMDYRTYPGLGHDTYPEQQRGIDDGAMDDILAWTAGRFAAASTEGVR